MFRAQPLYRVTLWCLASEAPDVALLLARHGVFCPVAQADEVMPENPAEAYREVFLEAEARLSRILQHCELAGEPLLPADAVAPTLSELMQLNDWLREVWQVCSRCMESALRVEEERRRLASLRQTYGRLQRLNLDLSRLLRADSLLDARLGQVPSANVRRLRDALALAGYILSPFEHAEGQTFAVVVGPRKEREGIADLLSQAGWRELPVPQELQTHPAAAREYLERQERQLEALSELHCQERAQSLSQLSERIREVRIRLALARPLAEAAAIGVRGRRHLAVFSGWVPRRAVAGVRAALEARFHGRYWIAAREPTRAELEQAPSLLTYPRWLQPFLPLVHSYGVPRYGEFDPTLLFAVTYVLLFGAMFGDVGHGAVIMLLASLLRGRYHWLRVVGMSAGAASILFGFVYGSVFGDEQWLPPVWQSPLHDPGQMLVLAVMVGVGFIGVTLLINTYNRLMAGHVLEALLDGSGLAGLVLYLAMVASVIDLYQQGKVGLGAGGTALAAWAVVAVGKWVQTPATLGERLLVTLIEGVETVSKLFANTLSFLRVAAFSLNHVALALAVFTLAAGMPTAGHWFTLFLGHAVIVLLEGGIVAIQALRLMYYEGFSRFFSGSGVLFTPLSLAQEGR